jgi:hypothetical protein
MKKANLIGKGLGIALVVCLMLGSMIGVAGSTERTNGESISGMVDRSNESAMSPTDNKAEMNDVSATIVSYPFFDDMESGVGEWVADPPWGLTEESSHSTTHSWTDSPGTNYDNNVNVALTLTIDLSTATMPVLSFWHRYSLETNKDWGFIDVSTDLGNTWTAIYFVTGSHTTWREEKIDLSQYVGVILIFRFRLKTDGANTYDGWYIDDVRIDETTAASISYPFFDDMESGEVNWLSSSWELVPLGYSGTYCFHDSPEGGTHGDVDTSLTLASTIDLSTAENPQMTFWEHYDVSGGCYVEISTDYGDTWTSLASYSGTQASWKQHDPPVDLSDYAGLSTVRIRFRRYSHWGGDGWYIDDVRIGALNDPPVANDDAYTTNENTMLDVPAPGVLSNDSDPDGDPITAIKVTDPSHGTVTLNSDGSFTYVPDTDFSGPDSFTYKANDGSLDSNTATVTITVSEGTCGDVAPYPGCNGIVDMGDVVLLLNYVGHPGEYELCCEWCGDVAPCPASDGVINMGDVVLLLNYVGYPGEYELCCG